MIHRPCVPAAPRTAALRDRGAVVLGLAIVFPVVLTAVMLVVQASLWWYADQVALTALREGVDAGRVRGATAEDGDARVREFLARFGRLAELESVDHAGSDAETQQMTVTVRPQSVVPFFDRLTITETLSAPRERFVPQGGRP
ncbi:TadE/TadG family type IV pilus assembly protein [Streptomyces sp. NRRL B-24484]|uniref:TadE/TadG family type IV pilus assembly protein n=1 Tax=Streptomyces sp. NRRL B-24484 TaxID=1463833 RepID=UPI000694F3E1|nr:TadE family protein [Streptomyces sp. NRRL B-24484]